MPKTLKDFLSNLSRKDAGEIWIWMEQTSGALDEMMDTVDDNEEIKTEFLMEI